MKRLLCSIALLCNVALAQPILQHQIADDSYARIPLQFPFPYYGRVFTESYMFSNGVVGFLNPTNHWCCTGFDLRTNNGTPFDFAIMPLQTDLINYGQGRFLTQGTPQYQRYMWENISEYGAPQNLNTFGVEIRPNGYISMQYERINISPWRPVTIGMTGDTSQGQYTQHYHGSGFTEGLGRVYTYNPDPCSGNPLYSPSCQGYQEALLVQQCTINTLYSPSCPGYAEAYALANIITPRQTVTTPTVQVSSTGTISVETPIVADPVVNEVISTPTTTSQTSPTSITVRQTSQVTSQVASQTEKKEEKKEERKEVKPQPKAVATQSKPVETAVGIAPTIKVADMPKGFDIIDHSHKKLIANLPSIRENRRILWMSNDSDKKHREMVDGQWNR